MRKRFLHLFALPIVLSLFLAQSVFAQNSSPYWSLAGNSNATTSSKLGTTNSIPLRLLTNNTVRIYVSPSAGYVGVGTTAPTERLHINSASGKNILRGQVNGSTKLLSHSNGGLTVGSGSTPPTNGLYVAGNVGIGTATPLSGSKVDVEGGSSNYALYANTTGNFGVYGNSNYIGTYGQGPSYGVYGYSTSGYGVGASSSNSWGVYAYGVNGIYGQSNSTSSSAAYGVEGVSNTATNSAGVYGTGYFGVQGVSSPNTGFGVDGTGWYVGVVGHGSTANSFSYGIEGYGNYVGAYCTGPYIGVQASGGKYGVYASNYTSGGYAGYFSGNVYSTGSYLGSDRKLKKNIEDVSSAVNIISQLHPKEYEFRQDGNYKYLHLPEGKHYGLIAQDLEQVLPTLVKDTKFDTRIEQQAQAKAESGGVPNASNNTQASEVIDFKAVNYTELIPILVKAVQEQQAQIEELKNEVTRLKQGQTNGTYTNILSQNTPNPASNNTRISYNLPAGTSQAHLSLTDAVGKTIKVISLNASGVIDVNTAALSSGVYNYTLLIDGKPVQTKKMLVAR